MGASQRWAAGRRFMWQIGQVPGESAMTVGCMGQVYGPAVGAEPGTGEATVPSGCWYQPGSSKEERPARTFTRVNMPDISMRPKGPSPPPMPA